MATKKIKKAVKKKAVKKKATKKKATKKKVAKKKAVKKKATKKKVAKRVTKKAAKRVTKKTSKKVAKKPVKKVTKKAAKRVTKKTSKKVAKRSSKISLDLYDVQDVPEHQHFYFVNGKRVKNVKEMAEIMDRLEQEVFDYHVNAEKNDFANWVKDVFKDIELAEKLLGVTGPKHLQFTVYKHVADKALKN